MKQTTRVAALAATIILTATGCSLSDDKPRDPARWLAGDHHIHSQYSVGYDRTANPPTPIVGGDAIYPIPKNALMARQFGLSWTVATDHGGPGHSKVNLEMAYPELLESRISVPEVIQFYGMELNPPGADHASLIIPKSPDEAAQLEALESGFDRYNEWPIDPARNDEKRMLTALETMAKMKHKPVVIANHPSRSATDLGEYGLDDPAELRGWNTSAPDVAVGMAGAPGHQAATLSERKVPRGAYGRYPTLGGFDQMTAQLGGFWDSMLGEGRRWWITANSDSHVHYTEGGIDFWPGEFSKTYVFAEKSHDSILAALRAGKIFVTTGDLVSELYVEVEAMGSVAGIGESLRLATPGTAQVTVRVRDPSGTNFNEDSPEVMRIDLIQGAVTGTNPDLTADENPSTRVVKRFTSLDWKRDGEVLTMSHQISVDGPMYIRIRGTNTDQLEPEKDREEENPWRDLWFYSNPVFIESL